MSGGVARVRVRYVSCRVGGVLKQIRACSVQRHLTAHRPFAAGLAVVGAALAPGRADACGASPSPSYTIGSVSPSSGSTAVARDAGIIVTGVPSLSSSGASTFADVELIDADTDEAVPLRSISWYSLEGPEATMALHPSEPLEPQHSYRVEAKPLDLSGDGAEGAVFVTNFMTSDALLEPLVLSGTLGLSLRGGQVDILECTGCGGGCWASGKRRALLADVQLPAPSGGQGVYRGLLHFSDRTPTRISASDPGAFETPDADPHDVHLVQLVKIEAGEAQTLQQEVIEEDFAYAGCFTLVVWDPAGHVAQTSACLPSLSADDIQALASDDASVPLSMDEGIPSEQVPQTSADSRESAAVSSCAVGANPASTLPAWLMLLLTSFLVRSLSRQR
jgi:hypothetical protein